VTSRDEVGAMAVAFNQMQDEINRAGHALDRAREALSRSRVDLEYLATHDSLTTLPNRRHVKDEVVRLVADCVISGRRCAVVALDLDGFKYINDSRGHAVGDQVLSHVADLFRAQLRPTDYIGRVGGDEFAAVLANVTVDEAQLVIFRLLEALRAETIVVEHGRAVRVTASAGMAFLDPAAPRPTFSSKLTSRCIKPRTVAATSWPSIPLSTAAKPICEVVTPGLTASRRRSITTISSCTPSRC
jgi:diguanylate cyclase (GGDEF)-like protein